jgi:hypothetical protein
LDDLLPAGDCAVKDPNTVQRRMTIASRNSF